MKNFFRSTKFKFIICTLTALLLGIFLAAFTNDAISPLTSAAGVIYSPIQKVATAISEKTADWKGSFVSSSVYKEKIKELESEAVIYNEQLVDYERTKQKLAAYEEFLKVREDNPDYEFCPASIITRNTADVYDSFTLDKGASDGISVNDPVIYGNNIVGLVKEVGAKTCVVKTILDPTLNISVYEIKSRENGYSNTTAALSYDGFCRISGLSKDTAVAPGGIVCTSGLGGTFPRDLTVGTITSIKNEDANVSVYGIIEPAVNIRTLNDVFVITSFAELTPEEATS